MLNRVENPRHKDIEMTKTPEGKAVESFVGGEIRVHDGHSPKTTVDISGFNTHVSIHKFGPFEFNKAGEIDEVFVRRGHHKNRFVAGFTDKKNGEAYEYDVWSPEGIIGSANGKRLDLLIASLFCTDRNLEELIKDASMDNQVKRYLKFAIITAGAHITDI